MDKKLTDSEIKNLLECCSKSTCSDCGYSKECDSYSSIRYALDLIDRLQAENEKKDEIYIDLLKTSSERADIIGQQGAEIERLKTEKNNLIKTYSECQIANLQEFMHRVENKLADNTDISMVGFQSVILNLEQTYKEMVGEDNAKTKKP